VPALRLRFADPDEPHAVLAVVQHGVGAVLHRRGQDGLQRRDAEPPQRQVVRGGPAAGGRGEVQDGVLAVAGPENEAVVAGAPFQGIVAAPSQEQVVAGAAAHHVAARGSGKNLGHVACLPRTDWPR